MIFEVKLSSDFGHAETGSGAKKRSGFLFTCGNLTLIFTVFFVFWIGFFSKWFYQSIHSPFKV